MANAKPMFGLQSFHSIMGSTSNNMHDERHKGNSQLLREIIIGFMDGVTLPFAITAGLAPLGNSKIVILGGLAILLGGAIIMGIGGFMASLTARKHYEIEEKRERQARWVIASYSSPSA